MAMDAGRVIKGGKVKIITNTISGRTNVYVDDIQLAGFSKMVKIKKDKDVSFVFEVDGKNVDYEEIRDDKDIKI